jgi:hypothetical protein
MPKHSPGYQFRTTIDFGDRTLLRKAYVSERGNEIQYTQPTNRHGWREIERSVDGRQVLREMAQEYMGMDYDLLRKNCCTFAHDACLRMSVREPEIPSWFHNLARAGALTQDAAVSTISPITQAFSSCDCDVNGGMPEYVSENGFDVYQGQLVNAAGEDSSSSTEGAAATEETDDNMRRTASWKL